MKSLVYRIEWFFIRIGLFLLNVILLPWYLLTTIFQSFVVSTAIIPFRFVSFFTFIGYRKSYKFWKIVNILICFVPLVILTIIEFAVFLIEIVVTKCISVTLSIFGRIDVIPNLIFGLLTLLLIKVFEALQFLLLLPDVIPYGTLFYIQNNPITLMYPDVGDARR